MHRFRRILFNTATVLSAILCVAAGVLWVRGYWREDVLGWDRPFGSRGESRESDLISGGGGMTIWVCFRSPLGFEGAHSGQWFWVSFGRTPAGVVSGPSGYAGGPIR